MVQRQNLSISEKSDADSVVQQATALIDDGRWRLCHDGAGLERKFQFKTFKATWDFMTEVAEECKKQKHHPEWTNVFNQTTVVWTTHRPKGMSEKDVAMAEFCDEAAKKHGEVSSLKKESKT